MTEIRVAKIIGFRQERSVVHAGRGAPYETTDVVLGEFTTTLELEEYGTGHRFDIVFPPDSGTKLCAFSLDGELEYACGISLPKVAHQP